MSQGILARVDRVVAYTLRWGSIVCLIGLVFFFGGRGHRPVYSCVFHGMGGLNRRIRLRLDGFPGDGCAVQGKDPLPG